MTRTSLLLVLLLWLGATNAQPVFLTEDRNVDKNTDGYPQGYHDDSPKELDGISYFSTPNFRLYRTDGTAAGTIQVVQFPTGSLVFVRAVTKRFVYFTIRSGESHLLKRLDRSTLRQESLTHYGKPLTLETAYSKVFVSGSKTLLAIRMHNYSLGITQLVAFPDDGPTDARVVMVNLKSDESSMLTVGSDIAFLNDQIFYNGFQNREINGKKDFEYIIQSSVPANKAGDLHYDIKNLYSLRSKGYELNDHFYTVDDSLFTIGFFRNATTGARDLFVGSLHPQTLKVPATIPTDQNFAWAEVLDHQLFLINGTRLLNWVPGSEQISEVYRKRTYQYQNLQPYRSLLKCGDFIVFREEDSLRTFDMRTRTFSHVTMPDRFIPQHSLYKLMDHYAWTTDKFIYYITYTGLVPGFTQYDPKTKQSQAVAMPQLKGERFDSFLAIFQTGEKFLFLTRYLGKKEKPVYRIFSFSS